MKWLETKVIIQSPDTALAIELISNIFFELDLKGVVIDDQDSAVNQIEENAGQKDHAPAVTGYWPVGEDTTLKRRRLENRLCYLGKEWGIESRIRYRNLDDERWSEY